MTAPSADYVRLLIDELDAYIAWLNEANNGPISLAYAHGWRCPQSDIDKGKQFRERISKLRQLAQIDSFGA